MTAYDLDKYDCDLNFLDFVDTAAENVLSHWRTFLGMEDSRRMFIISKQPSRSLFSLRFCNIGSHKPWRPSLGKEVVWWDNEVVCFVSIFESEIVVGEGNENKDDDDDDDWGTFFINEEDSLLEEKKEEEIAVGNWFDDEEDVELRVAEDDMELNSGYEMESSSSSSSSGTLP